MEPMLVLGFAWFLGVAIELSPSGLLTAIAGDFRVSIATAGTHTTFYALGEGALLVLPLTALALRCDAGAPIRGLQPETGTVGGS
jgi:predicted MFS family arabinose efflux permease